MVKRYTPDAKIKSAFYGDEFDEAVPVMERSSVGDFVKYEAYRSLETKYNKLFYGEECVRIAKRSGLSCEEVLKRVQDFCYDHYDHFQFYPADMEIKGNIVINYDSMMAILFHSEK